MDLFGQVIETVKQELAGNDFLSGGFILILLTGLLASMRQLPAKFWYLMKRRVLVSLEIMGDSTAYPWIRVWLAGHRKGLRVKHVTVMVQKKEYYDHRDKQEDHYEPVYSPAPGTYLFTLHRWPMMVRVIRDDVKMGDVLVGFKERLIIMVPGRGRKFIEEIVEEARQVYKNKFKDQVEVYFSVFGSWTVMQRPKPRALDTVVLQAGIKKDLLADIAKFYQGQEWYHERGIPWKRGYLLEGPPGNGKTSLIMAVAGHLESNIYVLNLSGIHNDQTLISLMNQVPVKSMILIEDVDQVFKSSDKVRTKAPRNAAGAGSNKEEDEHVTISGLMNAIDGITTHEGSLLFMTTNYPGRIDARLLRPGRIDRRIRIGDADQDQVSQMARVIYGNQVDGQAEEIAQLILSSHPSVTPQKGRNGGHARRCNSMAVAQELMLEHEDPRELIESLK